MSMYSAKESVSKVKRSKNRIGVLGRHMNHQANTTTKLRQSGKDFDMGRQSIPVNNSPRKEGVLVIICTSERRSVDMREDDYELMF